MHTKPNIKRIFLILLIGLYFAVAYTLMNYFEITCVFLKIFGIPCPGCGMTRAALALIRMDFYSAVKHNFLVFFMPYVFMYVFFEFKHKIHNKILLGIAIIAIINWIFKLIAFF